MELQKDFKELLKLFNKHKVEYAIVGAYALAFYGSPRYTGDLDLVVKPDVDNAEKIIEALKEFGFKALCFRTEDFSLSGKVVQLGVVPVRVDILTSLTGIDWAQAAKNFSVGKYGSIKVNFIGKQEFVANKKALGRHKDLADIESITDKK